MADALAKVPAPCGRKGDRRLALIKIFADALYGKGTFKEREHLIRY